MFDCFVPPKAGGFLESRKELIMDTPLPTSSATAFTATAAHAPQTHDPPRAPAPPHSEVRRESAPGDTLQARTRMVPMSVPTSHNNASMLMHALYDAPIAAQPGPRTAAHTKLFAACQHGGGVHAAVRDATVPSSTAL